VRRLLLALTVGSVCACGLISGASDLVIEDAADATAEASVDSNVGSTDIDAGPPHPPPPPTCAAPATCVAAPTGWDGPFAVVLSDANGRGLTCPPAFVRSWARSGASTADASAPPATCTCACGALTGTCAITMNDHDDSRCTDAPSKRVLTVGACVPTAGGSDSWRATAAVTSASCAPDASVAVTPVGGDAGAIGCVPTSPAGCATGACFSPVPTGVRLCVRPQGTGNTDRCPPEFPGEVTLASGVEDSRACTACTCPASPSCAFTYGLYGKDNCGALAAAPISDTNCHAPNEVDGIKLTASGVAGSCAPSGGKPTGGVQAMGESRLCCAP
jgi:hypothetical protein